MNLSQLSDLTGDMHMAMETLLTAIAVIKQSRVYEDDCCQALVTSLKDCLVSIRGNYDSRFESTPRMLFRLDIYHTKLAISMHSQICLT